MNLKKLTLVIVLLSASPAWAGVLTGPQSNAVRSAKLYLRVEAFSKSGLIHQLSSTYGSGYSVSTAKVAVNSLNVNWDNQAVKAAKLYLRVEGFSCNGLINQLSSRAEGFTEAQATYGARHTSACQ